MSVLQQPDNNSNLLSNKQNDQEVCPICFDQLTNMLKLPCNHKFCISCIKSLKHHNIMKCPICRDPFCYLHSRQLIPQNQQTTQHSQQLNQVHPENIIVIQLNNTYLHITETRFNNFINEISSQSSDIYDLMESQSLNYTSDESIVNSENFIGIPLIIPQHHSQNLLLAAENQNIPRNNPQNNRHNNTRQNARGSRSRRRRRNGEIRAPRPRPDIDEIQRRFLCRFLLGIGFFFLLMGLLNSQN